MVEMVAEGRMVSKEVMVLLEETRQNTAMRR